MKLLHHVSQPIEVVADYLTDMQKFTSVHPVIYKMEPIGNYRFKVFEKLTLAFVPFHFTYWVEMKNAWPDGWIEMNAHINRWVRINIHFDISARGNETLVSETVDFKTGLPIRFLMKSIFRKQHTQLFKNISNL